MNVPDSGSDRAEHRRIVEMLRALRNAHEHIAGVLRHGSCYELYQVLRALYPDAEPWKLDDHVYTRIRGRFYDIHGERKLDADEMRRAVPKFERRDPPHRWRNRDAERRRGFAQRTHSIVTVGWEVRALQAAYAVWRRALQARTPCGGEYDTERGGSGARSGSRTRSRSPASRKSGARRESPPPKTSRPGGVQDGRRPRPRRRRRGAPGWRAARARGDDKGRRAIPNRPGRRGSGERARVDG